MVNPLVSQDNRAYSARMERVVPWEHYRGFLLDVDGVLVRDTEVLPGAPEALAALRRRGRVLLVSNNSTLSRAAYAEKLHRLGFELAPEAILSSAVLAARYLDRYGPSRVFVVGEAGLRQELVAAGHALVEEDAGWLVTGMDRTLSYDKLARGLKVLLAGGRWVGTNADATFPVPGGVLPGAGAVVGAFRGMGFEPEAIVGKPSRFCFEQALSALGVENPREVLMIGDRLDSDIRGAAAAGLDSLLVLSGVTARPAAGEPQPTYVAASLAAAVG